MAAKSSKDRGGKKDAMCGSGASSGVGGGDEFGRAVAKMGVAQVCESLGFHAFQRSAAEALADIALRYLSDLAKAAHFYANLAGRTQCNALDVILAMEDVGTGPNAATDTARSLSSSASLRDVMRYVEYSEEIPFARPVPHFPVSKKRAAPPSFAQLGETPPQPHIPAWLPAFPDPHTYRATPVWNERKSDPCMDKLEQARQRRKAERSLVALHLRLSARGLGVGAGDASSSGSALVQTRARSVWGATGPPQGVGIPGPQLVANSTHPQSLQSHQEWSSREQEALLAKMELEGSLGKAKGKKPAIMVQNPFLAAPLPAGERELSPISFARRDFGADGLKPDGDGQVAVPSVLEAFAPALKVATKSIEHDESEAVTPKEQAGSIIPESKDRVPVSLTFDWGRKTRAKAIVAQLSLARSRSPVKKGKGGVSSGKEEEKDEKRKRAEQILAQAMEDSEDVGPQT